jgi:hypothetical protein
MKTLKIILSVLTLFFMGWAVIEQTKDHPKIWVQIIGIALFFYSMMRLIQKTPSNFTPKEEDKLQKEDENVE